MFAFVYSCDKKDTGCVQTEKERAILNAVADSVYNISPKALNMVQYGLKNAKDSISYYEYYIQLAKLYFVKAKIDSTLYCVEKTMNFVQRQKTSPRLNSLCADAYETKANYYYHFYQKPDESIVLHHKAYVSLMKSDNIDFAPDVCANLADVYQLKNDLVQASVWYRRALFLVDSLKLPATKNVTLYMGLAKIHQNLNDNKQAGYYYHETEKYFDWLQPGMKVYYLCNSGNFYYYMKDYNNALRMFNRMKSVVKRHYTKEDVNNYLCYINLSDVYLNLGKLDSASYYINLAEPYFTENKIDIGVYYSKTIRIGLALRQNAVNSINGILKSENVKHIDDQAIVGIRNRYLQDYYVKVGDYRNAYLNLKQSINVDDSIEKKRSYMRASEIMSRFTEDTLSLHHKIAMQQKNVEVRNANVSLFFAIVVAIMVCMTFLIWIFYSRKKQVQGQMNMMQLRLSNTRNRISPHFVFNVLNNKITNTNKQEADELMKLVKLIRANLDVSRNNYISIKEELSFVNYYIDVERSLIGSDFSFEVIAPDDRILDAVMIPSMFVQILVENAIKHGLKGLEGHKNLQIKIDDDETTTIISVIDNGRGFDIRRSNANSTKTGLNVIKQTINLINQRNRKNKMTFRIHNVINDDGTIGGCKSIINIPRKIKLV